MKDYKPIVSEKDVLEPFTKKVHQKKTIKDTRGFCLNSGRWIEFMIYGMCTPKSCPMRLEGEVECIYEKCPYHEYRKPTRHYIEKRMLLASVFGGLGE